VHIRNSKLYCCVPPQSLCHEEDNMPTLRKPHCIESIAQLGDILQQFAHFGDLKRHAYLKTAQLERCHKMNNASMNALRIPMISTSACFAFPMPAFLVFSKAEPYLNIDIPNVRGINIFKFRSSCCYAVNKSPCMSEVSNSYPNVS
jgi:hypothetical protein